MLRSAFVGLIFLEALVVASSATQRKVQGFQFGGNQLGNGNPLPTVSPAPTAGGDDYYYGDENENGDDYYGEDEPTSSPYPTKSPYPTATYAPVAGAGGTAAGSQPPVPSPANPGMIAQTVAPVASPAANGTSAPPVVPAGGTTAAPVGYPAPGTTDAPVAYTPSGTTAAPVGGYPAPETTAAPVGVYPAPGTTAAPVGGYPVPATTAAPIGYPVPATTAAPVESTPQYFGDDDYVPTVSPAPTYPDGPAPGYTPNYNPNPYPAWKRTPEPTRAYVPPSDDVLDAEQDDEIAKEWAQKTNMEKAEAEWDEISHDKNVKIVSIVFGVTGFFLLVFVAHQLIENPDGFFGKVCRCLLACIRILCWPLRAIFCRSARARDRRTHQLVNSEPGTYGYSHDLELT